jgi:hypothetical protein
MSDAFVQMLWDSGNYAFDPSQQHPYPVNILFIVRILVLCYKTFQVLPIIR